jgi:hypothetical protein
MTDDAARLDLPPTADELVEAIARHTAAVVNLDAARRAHDEARRRLVEVLHDAGVVGFTL